MINDPIICFRFTQLQKLTEKHGLTIKFGSHFDKIQLIKNDHVIFSRSNLEEVITFIQGYDARGTQ